MRLITRAKLRTNRAGYLLSTLYIDSGSWVVGLGTIPRSNYWSTLITVRENNHFLSKSYSTFVVFGMETIPQYC